MSSAPVRETLGVTGVQEVVTFQFRKILNLFPKYDRVKCSNMKA